jgi:hypothetical protein
MSVVAILVAIILVLLVIYLARRVPMMLAATRTPTTR